MKRREPRGSSRQEPRRTKPKTEEPARPTARPASRVWALCKAFVHAFKELAAPVVDRPRPAKRRKGDGDRRTPWQQRYTAYKASPKLKLRPLPRQQRPAAPPRPRQQSRDAATTAPEF
jgi:hypothetical protein